VGSECVEEAAIFVSKQIGEEVKKKAFIPTKRFSPGYGDLSLEVQRYFFKKLKLMEMGINLNLSLLMLPQKSITAFIGWRKREVEKK
jgi:cobalamin-dependent methionine synthase I